MGEVFITPREPDACPMRGLRAKALEHGRTFLREAKDDDLGGLASELAFKLTLATFPLLLFLAALSSYLFRWFGADDPAGRVISALGDSLPPDAASVIERSVNEVLDGSNPGIVSIGAITTLWAASGAARALIKAVNRVNDLEDTRPGWQRAGLAVGLTLFGGIALLGAITAVVASDVFAREVAGSVGLGPAWSWATGLARLPLIVVFVMFTAQVFFMVTPAERPPFRWWSPGAVLFGLCWSIFAAGFSFYVTQFAAYSATYGSVAGVAVFLIWLNISSWLLLAAAEWNWVMEHPQAAPAFPPSEPASVPEATPATAAARADGEERRRV